MSLCCVVFCFCTFCVSDVLTLHIIFGSAALFSCPDVRFRWRILLALFVWVTISCSCDSIAAPFCYRSLIIVRNASNVRNCSIFFCVTSIYDLEHVFVFRLSSFSGAICAYYSPLPWIPIWYAGSWLSRDVIPPHGDNDGVVFGKCFSRIYLFRLAYFEVRRLSVYFPMSLFVPVCELIIIIS